MDLLAPQLQDRQIEVIYQLQRVFLDEFVDCQIYLCFEVF